jgi:hypothetical protein
MFSLAVLSVQGQSTEMPSVMIDTLVDNPYEEEYHSPQAEDEEVITYDTILTIRSIQISADSIRLLKNKKELSYLSSLDSVLDAQQRQLEEEQGNNTPSFNMGSPDSSFLRQLMWLLAICFIVFVVYQLFQNKGFFKGGSRKLVLPAYTDTKEDDMMELDIGHLLQQAEQQGNYRLATRYQFISTLQQLHHKQLIEFAADKTNRQYLYELPAQYQPMFSTIVFQYEHVWFGNMDIDEIVYHKITALYFQFNSSI